MNTPEFALQSPEYLQALPWLILVTVGLLLYARLRRRSALSAYAGAGAHDLFCTDRIPKRGFWKSMLCLAALCFVMVALARPAWNPQPQVIQQKGREVIFLLDVSRSMLADDMRPSRLERAKLSILDCLGKLKGDRAGLVVFAGSAQTLCPLTVDYSFLRLALENAGPQSVSKGGTMLCDAIRKATSMLNKSSTSFKDIILITDGGDDETADESSTRFAIQAASEAREKGVRIIAIGIGDATRGQRIPLTDAQGNRTFLKHNGNDVVSRLNAALLRKIAETSLNGRYVNVGVGDFDLGALYQALVGNAQKGDLQESKQLRYQEKFQLFLAVALCLLVVELFVRERQPQPLRS